MVDDSATPLNLSIQGHARFADLPARSTLARWVRRAVGGNGSGGQLVLRFVDAREGRKLNRDFRVRDYATNVLTFDYARSPLWADIVICMPVVRREARLLQRPLSHHLAHLVIHGILHAQGHDHLRPGQARRMEAAECVLLAPLGIADPYLISDASN